MDIPFLIAFIQHGENDMFVPTVPSAADTIWHTASLRFSGSSTSSL